MYADDVATIMMTIIKMIMYTAVHDSGVWLWCMMIVLDDGDDNAYNVWWWCMLMMYDDDVWWWCMIVMFNKDVWLWCMIVM